MTYINRLEKAIEFNGDIIEPELNNLSLKPVDGVVFIVPKQVWVRNRRSDIMTPDPKRMVEHDGFLECNAMLCH